MINVIPSYDDPIVVETPRSSLDPVGSDRGGCSKVTRRRTESCSQMGNVPIRNSFSGLQEDEGFQEGENMVGGSREVSKQILNG